MSVSVRRSLLAVTLACAGASAQDLIVVDDDGGADFLDLPAAMAAAQSGDVVLVRAGTYSGFSVSGKAVDVEADGAVTVVGTISVSDLGASDHVVFRGVRVDADAVGGPKPGFVFDDCDGAVLLELCEVDHGAPGASFSHCADVALVDCEMTGRDGSIPLGIDAQSGVDAFASNIAFWGGFYEGGTGLFAVCFGPGTSSPATKGGFGVHLEATTAFLDAGFDALGGSGGDGCENDDNMFCLDGGDGGDALFISADSSVVDQGGGGYSGGAGGVPGNGLYGCFEGFFGGSWSGPGPIEFLNLETRGLTLESPVTAGGTLTLGVSGAPGETVLLLVGAPASPYLYKPSFRGVLMAPSFVLVSTFTTLSGPSLSVPVGVPSIAPFEVVDIAVQAAFVGPGGTRRLSPPSHVVIVGP